MQLRNITENLNILGKSFIGAHKTYSLTGKRYVVIKCGPFTNKKIPVILILSNNVTSLIFVQIYIHKKLIFW